MPSVYISVFFVTSAWRHQLSQWFSNELSVICDSIYAGHMSTSFALAAQVRCCSTLSTPWLWFVSWRCAWASVVLFLSAWPTVSRWRQEDCDTLVFCIWCWWLLSHQPKKQGLFGEQYLPITWVLGNRLVTGHKIWSTRGVWRTNNPTVTAYTHMVWTACYNARPSTGDVLVSITINVTGTANTYGRSLAPDNGIAHALHTFASTVKSSQMVFIYFVALLWRLCCSSWLAVFPSRGACCPSSGIFFDACLKWSYCVASGNDGIQMQSQ